MSKTDWTSNRQARPKAAGDYLVTLEWPESESFYADDGTADARETGRMRREVDIRYYAAPGICADWAMEGEDPEDYHWTEQTGSAWHERVVAWMPMPEVYREELTEGYEYVWE